LFFITIHHITSKRAPAHWQPTPDLLGRSVSTKDDNETLIMSLIIGSNTVFTAYPLATTDDDNHWCQRRTTREHEKSLGPRYFDLFLFILVLFFVTDNFLSLFKF
jgi:hypothetical protein